MRCIGDGGHIGYHDCKLPTNRGHDRESDGALQYPVSGITLEPF